MKKYNSYEEMPTDLQAIFDRIQYEDADINEIREAGYIVETDGFGEIEWIGVNETAEEIYAGLKYETSFINMNWRIKAHAKGLNLALGVSGLIKMVGIDLANRLFDRAVKNNSDKVVCKLRRGLKITFYVK